MNNDTQTYNNKLFGYIITFILLSFLIYGKLATDLFSIPLILLTVISFILSILFSSAFKIPRILWETIGKYLHKITNPIILGLIFYVVFFPIGSVIKLTNLSNFRKKFDKNLNSYWLNTSKKFDANEFNNPF